MLRFLKSKSSHGMQAGLTASERRILLATWLGASWQMMRADSEFIRQAFVSTGFLIRKDGSENHLIKVKGISTYDFTNPDY